MIDQLKKKIKNFLLKKQFVIGDINLNSRKLLKFMTNSFIEIFKIFRQVVLRDIQINIT